MGTPEQEGPGIPERKKKEGKDILPKVVNIKFYIGLNNN